MKRLASKFPLFPALLATLLNADTGCQSAPHNFAETQTQAVHAATTSADALVRLRAGNERFVTGHSVARDLAAKRVDAVTKENDRLALRQVRERSLILSELIRDGKVGLVGGLQGLDSGRVTFFS